MATQIELPSAGEMELRKPSTMDLLQVALQNNAAIDVIERLAALQEKALARDAEIEFNEAMTHVQEQIKRVAPDLENKQTSSRYASYAAIDRKVRPIYAQAGFSLSFDTADCPLPEHIRVVCYVALRGHTRRYQIDMSCDGKGAKGGDVMTKTHASGAAMAYGMRYLLKGIFNIAVGEEDTDGNASNGELEEQIEWIQNAKDPEELKKLYVGAYHMFESNPGALKAIIAAKNARKAEL
jgi:hypothetical protein